MKGYEAMLPDHRELKSRIRADPRLNQLLIDNGKLLDSFYKKVFVNIHSVRKITDWAEDFVKFRESDHFGGEVKIFKFDEEHTDFLLQHIAKAFIYSKQFVQQDEKWRYLEYSYAEYLEFLCRLSMILPHFPTAAKEGK